MSRAPAGCLHCCSYHQPVHTHTQRTSNPLIIRPSPPHPTPSHPTPPQLEPDKTTAATGAGPVVQKTLGAGQYTIMLLVRGGWVVGVTVLGA